MGLFHMLPLEVLLEKKVGTNSRMFKKFLHFYIFTVNGEGWKSSNWASLRV